VPFGEGEGTGTCGVVKYSSSRDRPDNLDVADCMGASRRDGSTVPACLGDDIPEHQAALNSIGNS
jgi:hypothetical protein